MVSIGRLVGGSIIAGFALVLLVGGLVLAGGIASNAWQAHQLQQRAEPTDATVTNATVDKHVDCDTERGQTDCDVTWRVHVRYVYTVDGERYRSSVIRTPDYRTDYRSFAEEGPARTHAEQYPEGATVQAYYDPRDPDAAFLEYGHPLSLEDLFVPLVILGFMVVPLAFLGTGLVLLKEGLER